LSGWWHIWTRQQFGLMATGILVLTALWEWVSLNGGWQQWLPLPKPVKKA
jgi:hypothetical protein